MSNERTDWMPTADDIRDFITDRPAVPEVGDMRVAAFDRWLSALAPVQPDPLRAGVKAFLNEYAKARPSQCGVCSGHSPSWDGHYGCETAAIERLRALLAETEGEA